VLFDSFVNFSSPVAPCRSRRRLLHSRH